MTKTVTGGCQCGGVQYEMDVVLPHKLHICHCKDCQRQSGGGFSITYIIDENAFRVTKGVLKSFTMKAQSGRDKAGAFCPNCGNRIYNYVAWRPGTVSIKPGTLDDTSFIDPKRHVWTASKQSWVTLPSDAEAYDHGPPGS
ncbi:MAG: GFA family protein [Rhodospirillaceae bacterium]